MVGIRLFPFGKPYFQVRFVSFREGSVFTVSNKQSIFWEHTSHNTDVKWDIIPKKHRQEYIIHLRNLYDICWYFFTYRLNETPICFEKPTKKTTTTTTTTTTTKQKHPDKLKKSKFLWAPFLLNHSWKLPSERLALKLQKVLRKSAPIIQEPHFFLTTRQGSFGLDNWATRCPWLTTLGCPLCTGRSQLSKL